MSKNSSDSESSYSDDSEYNYIPGIISLPLNFEVEDESVDNDIDNCIDELFPTGPYQDEPLADPEWLKEYQKKKEIEENLRKELEARISGSDASKWCSCGHCNVQLLQNAHEAKCCKEIERCYEACRREDVLVETGETPPQCITLHPGFRPVCLEKWSLKQSASKYKTREQLRYKQIGKETTFLRSVAYREFCQLVYGFLGAERIPLPACVYHAIRTNFSEDKETFTGFDDPMDP